MSKKLRRGNREARKPKAEKRPAATAAAPMGVKDRPFATVLKKQKA